MTQFPSQTCLIRPTLRAEAPAPVTAESYVHVPLLPQAYRQVLEAAV